MSITRLSVLLLLCLVSSLPAQADSLHVLTVKGAISPASAGTYILYASHIAAMAPATNLGAATPVELASGSAPPEKPATPDRKGDKPAMDAPMDTPQNAPPHDAKMKKAVHDAAAYIRNLAELRGRNADWAERAVREAVSLSAEAALQAMVVDIVAENLDDLLQQIHGRKVKLSSFGALGLGGIVAFAIGSVMLINTDLPGYGIPWVLIVPIAATTALFSFIVASMALRARGQPVMTGAEELLDAEGEFQASEKLLAAAEILSRKPQAMQLRYLQTLSGIAGDRTNTIVFPVPGDFLELLMRSKTPRDEA